MQLRVCGNLELQLVNKSFSMKIRINAAGGGEGGVNVPLGTVLLGSVIAHLLPECVPVGTKRAAAGSPVCC